MARQIQIRRGTSSDWTSSNPVLAQGEFAFETDTNKFKIGNGSSAWNALQYFSILTGADVVTLINGSASLIDDDNIASTIARDSEVTSAISTHAGNATAHHSNANDPSSGEKSALAGTSGTPGSANKYVTNGDARLVDARTPVAHNHSFSDVTSGTVASTGLLSTPGTYTIDPTFPLVGTGHFGMGNTTIGEMAMNDSYLSDKLQFIIPYAIEYTTDGTNWVPYTAYALNSTTIRNIFLGRQSGAYINILGPNNGNWLGIRFVFEATAYKWLEYMYAYIDANGHTCDISVARSDAANINSWYTLGTCTGFNGWPAHCTIGHNRIPWTPSPSSSVYSKYIRVTITPTWNGTYPNNNIRLYVIKWYGDYPANYEDSIYAWDVDRNVSFAGTLTASGSTVVTTNDSRLSNARTPTAHASTHVTGGSDVIANAIASGNAGLMSGADKSKLDGIESGATADLTATEIVNLINGSANLIDDDNIAASIARDSEVSSAISTHAGNATAHHSNANDPTSGQKAALAGSSGTPSDTNRYVTNDDSRMTNARAPASHGNEAHSATFITTAAVTYEALSTNGDIGSSASTLCAGNDSRLSDARTPTAHAASHISGADSLGLGTAAFKAAGSANGVADLDGTGKVPSGQLPSYVDDVIESTNFAALPVTGESGKIYVTLDDNKTYRWSGSAYVEISASLTLGELSTTAYRGDRGATAYSHATSTGNAHSLSASDIVGIINAGASIIDDDNIASTIARDSEVSSAISTHAGNATAHHSNANDPTSGQKAALAGTSGTVSDTNRYVTNDDSRMTDARTPATHSHGNITNAGAIGTTTDLPIKTSTGGVLVAGAFGTGATDFAVGNHTHSGVYEPVIASKGTAFNVNFGATAADACVGNDSRLSDARTPTSHTHGNITNAGAIGASANLPIITTTSGVLTTGTFGSSANTFCVGNDSRLSDSRVPTAHASTHVTGGSDVIANAIAGGNAGLMSGTDKTKLDGIESGATADMTANEIVTAINGSVSLIDDDNIASTLSRTSHVHGNVTAAGAIGSTANLPIITTTSGVLTTGSFGSSANTFCVGNDARLSDARTPTSHTHGNITNGGLIGTTANLPIITGTGGILQAGAFGTGATDFCVGNDSRLSDARTPVSHAHGNITNAGAIGSTANLPVITTTGGVLTAGSFGSSANTFCQGNDSRLSDSRTPTSHNNSAHSETYIVATGVTYEQLNTNGDVGTTSGTLCAGDDSRLVANAKQADRPFVFQTGHTAWATGLSNEEIGRIQLQTGETLYIKRVEIQIKGGGTSASLSVNAYDSTNTATIASQTAGGVNTTGGNSGSAALVLIRLTNSVGSTQSASVYISGWIRS